MVSQPGQSLGCVRPDRRLAAAQQVGDLRVGAVFIETQDDNSPLPHRQRTEQRPHLLSDADVVSVVSYVGAGQVNPVARHRPLGPRSPTTPGQQLVEHAASHVGLYVTLAADPLPVQMQAGERFLSEVLGQVAVVTKEIPEAHQARASPGDPSGEVLDVLVHNRVNAARSRIV